MDDKFSVCPTCKCTTEKRPLFSSFYYHCPKCDEKDKNLNKPAQHIIPDFEESTDEIEWPYDGLSYHFFKFNQSCLKECLIKNTGLFYGGNFYTCVLLRSANSDSYDLYALDICRSGPPPVVYKVSFQDVQNIKFFKPPKDYAP